MIAVVDQDDQEETVNKQGRPSGDSREPVRCVVTGKNYRNYGKNLIRNCYSCGATDHFIRSCPHRFCSRYGESGYKRMDCPSAKREGRGYRRPRIYQLADHEEAVTVEVRINHHKTAAMLDTGAKPSVIDVGTLQRLELEGLVIPVPSEMYGLCNNPVKVIGYVD